MYRMGHYNRFGYEPTGAKAAFMGWFALIFVVAFFRATEYLFWCWGGGLSAE